MALNQITVTGRYLSADERLPITRGSLLFTPPVILPSLFEIKDVAPTWSGDGNATWVLYSDTTQPLAYTYKEQLATGSRTLTLTIPQNVAAGTELDLVSLSGWSQPAGAMVVRYSDIFEGDDLFPLPASGQYFFPTNPNSPATSASQGNGNLRLTPFIVKGTLTIARLGSEVTVVGDAASTVRLCIYADSGGATPGPLVLDAGSISGNSATVQEIVLASPVVLSAGVYWVGGVLQNVTTTQPTVRIIPLQGPATVIAAGTSMPAAGVTANSLFMSGVSGALPATFTPTGTTAGAPRVFFKVA